MVVWNDTPHYMGGPFQREALWSERSSGREMRVFEALYGIDATGKPGFEVLEESKARLEQDKLEEERMAASQETPEVCFTQSTTVKLLIENDFSRLPDDSTGHHRLHRTVILSLRFTHTRCNYVSRPRARGRVSSQPPRNIN